MSQPVPSAWSLPDLEAGNIAEPPLTLPYGGGQLDDGDGSTQDSGVTGRRTRIRKRRAIERLRVRVNARGAAYVEGLERGRVYDAHIKPQWPDTVWLDNTGLSHPSFLFIGMYEVVEATDPTKS
jgi:hypothetical protein